MKKTEMQKWLELVDLLERLEENTVHQYETMSYGDYLTRKIKELKAELKIEGE